MGLRLTAAALLACTMSTAQELPDFTGTWKLPGSETAAPAAPRTPAGAPAAPPALVGLRITQTRDEITVERLTVSGRGRTTMYKLDGSEHTLTSGLLTVRTRVLQEGATLVFIRQRTAAGKPMPESREVYRLEEGRLVVEVQRDVNDQQSVARTIYEKS